MSITHPPAAFRLKVVAGYGQGAGLAEPRSTSRPAKRAALPERARVRAELERIMASADFDASRRSREMLHFIVEETLAGRGAALSQVVLATRVFERREDFDPLVDPIVRIQAGRLRRSLERYYLLSGAGTVLRIEVPRGTYVPAFRSLAEDNSSGVEWSPAPATASPAIPVADWPVLAVTRFVAPAGGRPWEPAARLMETLLLELGRYPDVRPVLRNEGEREPSSRERVRFSLEGRVREEDGQLKVSAWMVDHATGVQVWGDEYRAPAKPGQWSRPLDDIGRVIAARTGAEQGVIVQLLAAERRKHRLAPATPYGAILLSYDFFLAGDSHSLPAALHALRQAVAAEPRCGLAWTRLAHLCLANNAFEITEIPTPADQAVTYAHNGVRADPTSRQARAILAWALLSKGEPAAARRELEDALRSSPDSLVYLEVVGTLLSLLGDGERGSALIRAARERNPHCLPCGSFGLWFDHFRRGELELAYEQALEYRDPTFFWRAVMRASCLAQLGRAAEARAEVAEILRARKDFAARGRVLIGNVVKLPEVTTRIVAGLAKAGLALR